LARVDLRPFRRASSSPEKAVRIASRALGILRAAADHLKMDQGWSDRQVSTPRLAKVALAYV